MYPQALGRAALFMLGSSLMFAGMGVMVKIASRSLPNEMVVFFRSAIGLLVLLPWLLRDGVRKLATRRLRWHVTRGLAGLAAMYCFFFAIAHMPLAEAMVLNYSMPLFIPLIALIWLGERPPREVWPLVALGFLGVLLILKPGMGVFTGIALVALAGALLAAFAMVNIRRLTRTEPTTRIVFYFSLISTLASAVPLIWSWRTPQPGLWLLLFAMGTLATAAQIFLTRAYAHASSAQVGPFIYATVVFAGVLGWLAWGETPDALSIAGALLVGLAGALTIRFEPRPISPAVEGVTDR